MIKFFRKIRYNLMEQNKTGKYLKYAIGEILLVVIGILIALSINNFNEERKNRIEEVVFLEGIKADLLATKVALASVMGAQEKGLIRNRRLINLMEEFETMVNRNQILLQHKDSIFNYIKRGARVWYRVEPIIGTYDALIGSGKTSLIQNHELSRELALYSTMVKSGFEDQDMSTHIHSRIEEIISPYASELLVFGNSRYQRAFPIKLKSNEESVSKAMYGLLSNKSFQGSLLSKDVIETLRYTYHYMLSNQTTALIEMIDIELDITTETND